MDNATLPRGSVGSFLWPWSFGCLIPFGMLRTAESPEPSSWRARGPRSGAGKSRAAAGGSCSICPSPSALGEPPGGSERQPVPKKPGSHFLPTDTHWPGTSPCSRNADRVAAARIIGRLPRRGRVHVSLRCRSGYGTSTKPRPCIIQPLCYRRCQGEELSPAPAGASWAQAAPAAGPVL